MEEDIIWSMCKINIKEIKRVKTGEWLLRCRMNCEEKNIWPLEHACCCTTFDMNTTRKKTPVEEILEMERK